MAAAFEEFGEQPTYDKPATVPYFAAVADLIVSHRQQIGSPCNREAENKKKNRRETESEHEEPGGGRGLGSLAHAKSVVALPIWEFGGNIRRRSASSASRCQDSAPGSRPVRHDLHAINTKASPIQG